MIKPQLNWRGASLFIQEDPHWRRNIWKAGLFLFVPIIGWPTLLGYRKVAIEHLVHGREPLLPKWDGNVLLYLREGFKALLVINLWFLPLLCWVIIKFMSHHQSSQVSWLAICSFCLALPILSTMLIPGVVLLGRFYVSTPIFSNEETLLIHLLFVATTFFIPVGFLNVSRTGRYLSAFDFRWTLPTLRRNFRNYTEAWVVSGIMSLIGHFIIPFSPWGVTWCYLSIVYLFNEVPLLKKEINDVDYLKNSWFDHFRNRHFEQFKVRRKGLMVYLISKDRKSQQAITHKAIGLAGIYLPLP